MANQTQSSSTEEGHGEAQRNSWPPEGCMAGDSSERMIQRRWQALQSILSTRLTGFPLSLPPRGKYSVSLFDCLPGCLSAETGDEIAQWWKVLQARKQWRLFVFGESLRCFKCDQSRGPIREVNSEDAAFYWDENVDVLVIGHEPPYFWRVPFGFLGSCERTHQGADQGSPILKAKDLVDPVIDGKSLQAEIEWTVRQLRRKGLKIPRHKLVPTGPFSDHLWNYIPKDFDVSLRRGGFVRETIRSCGKALIWDSAGAGGVIKDNKKQRALKLPDVCLLEWPRRRWLLTIPNDYVRFGERDSYMMPSFVILQ